MKTGCETHTNVTFSEPFCPICLLNERDALQARVAELTMPDGYLDRLMVLCDSHNYDESLPEEFVHKLLDTDILMWLMAQKGAK